MKGIMILMCSHSNLPHDEACQEQSISLETLHLLIRKHKHTVHEVRQKDRAIGPLGVCICQDPVVRQSYSKRIRDDDNDAFG